MDTYKYRVPVEKLRKKCGEEDLEYLGTSMDVPGLDGVIGQDRAVKSMEFGLSMEPSGYNIFVVGPQGTGKSAYAQAAVSKKAATKPEPLDWCYINNFVEWDKPYAVSLPAEQGRIFQKDMDSLLVDLKLAMPKAFESFNFQQRRDSIDQKLQEQTANFLKSIEKEALEAGFSAKQIASGRLLFIPIINGTPIEIENYDKLSESERNEVEQKKIQLGEKLEDILHESEQAEKLGVEQILELDRQTALSVAEPLIIKLKAKYESSPGIVSYLEEVQNDIAGNHINFSNPAVVPAQQVQVATQGEGEADETDEADVDLLNSPALGSQDDADPFTRYKVNVFVSNEKSSRAPVIIESNPYYYNMFGKIEYKSQFLSMSTDFTMIKPGAIHRANGGYLILQAKDVLMDPFTWDALKKALLYNRAVVENIGEQYRYVPTVSLKPEPIPLDIKVILIGSPIYYMIFSTDEDFQKLFKVKVDFDMEMNRNKENIQQYVSFVSSMCREQKLKHFNRFALAKVVEFGSRIAGYQKKLSTQFNEVSEIIYEASALAQADGSEYVEEIHVDKAINDRKYRANMMEEKLQEMILQDKILIDTKGAVVGHLNGLFVLETIGYTFGLTARITARTYMGRGGVINIERETEMSGNIHSKGVLTLTGYLGSKLAQEKPMGLTAQVTFEQLYDDVDGDSASSAELYAILSSLSGIPLNQSIAVTGSLDQLGEIQPIGGVTEKIEGFFDICNAKGLSGEQGVMIPVRNIDNLMLKDEVIQAVEKKLFQIYAVNTVEEGIELLTGVTAGTSGENGKYPEGSIFYLADKKLQTYNKAMNKADPI